MPETPQTLSSEEGQAIVEYMLLSVMVITSSYILLKIFPDALKNYYFYVTALLGMPIA